MVMSNSVVPEYGLLRSCQVMSLWGAVCRQDTSIAAALAYGAWVGPQPKAIHTDESHVRDVVLAVVWTSCSP
jgi:hypothetical protein